MVKLALIVTLGFILATGNTVEAFLQRSHVPRPQAAAARDLKHATRNGIVTRQQAMRRGDLRPRASGAVVNYINCDGFVSTTQDSHAVYVGAVAQTLTPSSSTPQDNFKDCLEACGTTCAALIFDATPGISGNNCFLYDTTVGLNYGYDGSSNLELSVTARTCTQNAATAGSISGTARTCCNAPFTA